MTRVLDAARERAVPEARRQQQQSLTSRQRERMRRATRIWERQRSVFMRLLVESMDEFGITQAELSEERRKLAGRAASPSAATVTAATGSARRTTGRSGTRTAAPPS